MNQPCESGGVLLAVLGRPGLAVHLAAVGQRRRGPREHDLPHQRPQRVEHRLARARRRRPGGLGAHDLDGRGRRAAGDAGRDQRHLRRAHQHLALADRVRRLRRPGAVGRDAAAEDADRQLPVGADAVGRRRLGERGVGQLERLLDEGRVARLREGLGEGHRAEVELVLVLELAALDRRWCRGRRPGCPGVTAPGRQQRRRGDRLHARAGRELAGQRVARVGRLVGATPPGSRRCRAGRRPGAWAAAAPATAASAAFCSAGTSGVCTGVPGTGSTAATSTPGVAGGLVGADHRDGEAGGAGELLLEGALQAGEAELVAGGVARRAVVLGLLDDLGGGRADPAEQGRGEPRARRQQPGVGREDRAGQVEHLGADRLEVGPAQRDDRDELARGGRLDVGDDVLGRRCRWRRTAPAASDGRSVTWAVSTPTLTTSVGREQRRPGRVGDRRPLGQAAGELEVLPLPQLRVHERRARRRPATRRRPPRGAASAS